jgi:hypothetical protein
MTSLPIVAELRHSSLRSSKYKEIYSFQISYEAYQRQVEEVNETRPEQEQLKPSPLQHCLDPLLLRALIQLKVFDEFLAPGDDNAPQTIADPAELNHEVVEQWLESMSDFMADDMPSRLEEALRNVKFDYNRHDARGSAYEFFRHVYTKLTEAGCLSALETSGKAIIEQLTPKIQPPIVREIVEDRMKYWNAGEREDFPKFQKYTISQVIESACWTRKRTSDADGNPVDEEGHISKKKRLNKNDRDLQLKDNDLKNEGNEASNSKKQSRSKRPWTSKCLNPSCKLKHPLKECENTSAELKKTLDAHHEKKNLTTPRRVSLEKLSFCRIRSCRPEGSQWSLEGHIRRSHVSDCSG